MRFQSRAAPRNRALDGVRGVAIILVLIWHYFTAQAQVEVETLVAYVAKASQLSWSGVDLFFVLSGFLIGGILIDHRRSTNYFGVFYLRRACRILPLYLAMILCFGALHVAKPAGLGWLYEDPMPLWSYLTFTQNYTMGFAQSLGPNTLGITWSLAIEEQFYLLLPVVIRYVPMTRIPAVLTGLVLVGPISRAFVDGLGSSVYAFCRTDALMLGALIAWAVRDRAICEGLARSGGVLWAMLAILLIGAGALGLQNLPVGSPLGHLWLAALYGTFIVLVLRGQDTCLVRALSQPWLVWFGSRSYGIYLLHQTCSGAWHAH